MVKVAVLGAGISGLSSAVLIQEKYKNCEVTVISKEFSPNTTGDGAGGLWFPYMCGSTSQELIIKWSFETFAFLQEVWRGGDVNICLLPLFNLFPEKIDKPEWMKLTYGYQELNDKQLEYYSRRYSKKYVEGITFVTFVIPTTKLLEYFTKRFKDSNGKFLQANLSSIQDPILKDYDVVINCTGLAAGFLVPDNKMSPIRGQILKVKAPWLNEVLIDEPGHYIIPNVEICVLGGTHQDSYDTALDQKDKDYILDGCYKRIPSLQHAKIDTEWVGLRPGRESLRVEAEVVNSKLYIHNYGHGGAGFTLFWGSSNQVLQIFATYLNKRDISQRLSKL